MLILLLGITGVEASGLLFFWKRHQSNKIQSSLLFGNRKSTTMPILDAELEKRAVGATKLQRKASNFVVSAVRRIVNMKAFEHAVVATTVYYQKESKKSMPVRLRLEAPCSH